MADIRRVLLLSSFAIVAVVNGAASAAPSDVPTFFDLDKDGNGTITPDEGSYWSALQRRWSSVDKNGDDAVDMNEWNQLDAEALLRSGDTR